MRFILVFLFAFICFSATQAQSYNSGSLTLTNKTEVSGKFYVSTKNQSVEAKKNNTSYHFNKVESLSIDDRFFIKETFNGATYFTHELVSGKASLFQIESNNYLILKENGIFKEIDLKNDPNLVRGILSVLFEDCNTIRNDIYNINEFSEKTLISTITSYNSCSYSGYNPTETELKNANSFNTDTFKLYFGLGVDIKNINFFEDFYNENLSQFGLKFGLLASPGFTGKIQGNLYFYLDASLSFGSENDLIFIDNKIHYSVNTYRALTGIEYFFNKTGKINPFIGISGGTNWDRFSGDVNDDSFKIKSHNLIWASKAGVLFSLKNGKELGFTIDYIPEYGNELVIPINEELINVDISSSSFSFGLKYYF